MSNTPTNRPTADDAPPDAHVITGHEKAGASLDDLFAVVGYCREHNIAYGYDDVGSRYHPDLVIKVSQPDGSIVRLAEGDRLPTLAAIGPDGTFYGTVQP